MTTIPKVSVAIITYNHKAYIQQAIESVVEQQVDFPIEVVIGEDCSTDGTRVIVQSLESQYPDKIRLLLHDRNVGAVRNFMMTVSACTGKYLAILEGDDYWIDTAKLQRQVDFLEENPQYAFCFTGSFSWNEAKGQVDGEIRPNIEKPDYELRDLLSREFFPSGSVMLRRELVPTFPDWFTNIGADFIAMFEILHAQHGRIGKIIEPMSVYRRHESGLWTGAKWSQQMRWNADSFGQIDEYFCFRYSRDIRVTERYFKASISAESKTVSKQYLCRALRAYHRDPSVPPQKLLIHVLFLYAPILLRGLVALKHAITGAKKTT